MINSSIIQQILSYSLPHDLPWDLWWLAGLIFATLALCAAIDAFTAAVPDPLIVLGLFLVVGVLGFSVSWIIAAQHLGMALGAGLVIWIVNEIWLRIGKQDAIGMGDAKWTMLAVACFGVGPLIIAWGLGAWFALTWMLVLFLVRYPIARIHFAPFLLLGLMAGVYWLRLKG